MNRFEKVLIGEIADTQIMHMLHTQRAQALERRAAIRKAAAYQMFGFLRGGENA